MTLSDPADASFSCPRCGRTSHNPNDAREGYCGACHAWTAPRVTAVAPADASVADVRKALDRKFRIYGASAEVAMSIFGPVLEARDRLIARLRAERGQDAGGEDSDP